MTSTPEKHRNPRVSAIRARRDPKIVSGIQKAMKLAAAIEDAMIAKGWNRTQFAKAMNVKPSQITRWLSGTQTISSGTLFDMEYVLGTSLVLSKPVEIKNTEYVMVYKTITVPHHNTAVIDRHISLLKPATMQINNDSQATGEHAFYYSAQMTKQNVCN